ncbi:transcription elongation factor spt4 [Dimargaris cristalligena]|uniref:Transcription elongation factor SPT4 n=1 Tax=Dimargaris cristalligena TaxID=215637 RepID=A0A4V1J4W5_9FUNG|nr:transcription elongation factor spt4 [Dimargaris cristalligena]RKP36979.1 Spt4/RpoE2 zinc finger-domain-containing protein [Dimargaris cristalligena]|eukprot:RKP36979.1 Spt4/RpoE2 zinc finger-domain-containing protein [Dimargaris cristalligena]
MSTIIPQEKKNMRACLLCSLIKNQSQFVKNGCENCEDILRLRGNTERVLECTSANFNGFVALMRPEQSWLGRWQRIEKYSKGLYAAQVTGRIPEDVEMALEQRGITYRPRDGTVKD